MRRAPLLALALTMNMQAADLDKQVAHAYAENNGVKIHYATLGSGPLIVMIHGFPDFWYSWRHQMTALAATHQVAALDLRGYNLSGKPKGLENYDMKLLVGDVLAVIKHTGKQKAIVAGHDWGGAIAWSVATAVPQMVERLIVVNLPNPNGLRRELANNPEQQKNSAYARNFQEEDAHTKLTPEALAQWAPEAEREKYLEAFRRSDIEAMLAYYKRNYPREPYKDSVFGVPNAKMPVLLFHGLNDKALLPGALNDTWKWIDAPLTLVTIPNAGHWSHWDAADLVTATMKSWLALPMP